MRPLCLPFVLGSLVFACSIRTEVNGVPGSTSDEAGADAGSAPSVPGAEASATRDAAPASSARPDASSVAPEDGGSAVDATSCLVQASDYDQTCTVDTDCVNVGEVLMCPADECSFCRMETISTRAAAQYTTAFSRATAAIPADAPTCGCPDEGRPCCLARRCQQCFPLRPLR